MNCPLCKSTVLYVGLNSIECKGRKCQNFKGQAITKLTREYLREFFGKISSLSKPPKTWALVDLPQTAADVEEKLEYVELTGISAYPFVFCVGEGGPDIEQLEIWVRLYDPSWERYL